MDQFLSSQVAAQVRNLLAASKQMHTHQRQHPEMQAIELYPRRAQALVEQTVAVAALHQAIIQVAAVVVFSQTAHQIHPWIIVVDLHLLMVAAVARLDQWEI
jgi:hypothetical protein